MSNTIPVIPWGQPPSQAPNKQSATDYSPRCLFFGPGSGKALAGNCPHADGAHVPRWPSLNFVVIGSCGFGKATPTHGSTRKHACRETESQSASLLLAEADLAPVNTSNLVPKPTLIERSGVARDGAKSKKERKEKNKIDKRSYIVRIRPYLPQIRPGAPGQSDRLTATQTAVCLRRALPDKRKREPNKVGRVCLLGQPAGPRPGLGSTIG